MKTARLRMAGLAAALFIAVGGSIYGIAHLVSPADADTDRGSSSMASDDTTNIADAGTGAPDITSSATVTALSGHPSGNGCGPASGCQCRQCCH